MLDVLDTVYIEVYKYNNNYFLSFKCPIMSYVFYI